MSVWSKSVLNFSKKIITDIVNAQNNLVANFKLVYQAIQSFYRTLKHRHLFQTENHCG